MGAASCLTCGDPVDLATRHVVVAVHVETERDGEATVHDGEVLAYLHEDHSRKVRLEVD